MAMRGRGGRGNPMRPPRLIVNRVYEEFKPMSEWRQEDNHDALLVYLPGFQKEYIKVTTEDVNTVRVRGERLVSENKWSRFQEDYRVPENCEMSKIKARFDGGILTIIMPRKTTNAPPPPPPLPTTIPATSRVAPKNEEQPFIRAKQEETIRKPEEPKEKKPDTPRITTRLEDNILPPPPSKPAASSSSVPTKQPPPRLVPQAKETMEHSTEPLPKGGFEHHVIEKLKPGVGRKTDLDKGKGKETMREEETKRDIEGSKGKPSSSGVVSGGFRAGLEKVVAKRGVENEDRKLLVNVGVGILVIAALGVHVSYTIGLIGKGK